jgi:replicative DNA helicase
MSAGLELLGSLVAAPVKDFLSLTIDEEYFIGDTEKEAFKAVTGHVQSYGSYPTPPTLKELNIALPTATEPAAYYLDKVKHRYLHRSIKKMLMAAQDQLNAGKVEEAAESIMASIIATSCTMNQDKIVDFAEDGGKLVLEEFNKVVSSVDDGLKFGWESLDKMMGGLGGGDVISFVGRPGMGKTYMMLYGALSAWSAGHVPVFASMEMKPLPIVQRLATMLTATPISGLKDGFLTDKQQEKLAVGMGAAKKMERPFYVVDGAMASTPEDLLMMCRQLKPDVLFVDAAYLMGSSNKYLDKWAKVTENVEFVKAKIAEALNIPVILSYQINREGGKKKNGEKATLDDIAYSDAIGQVSSCVLGLFEDDNVETMKARVVSILKGRNGESGEFKINWDFDGSGTPDIMNFREILETAPADLGYV